MPPTGASEERDRRARNECLHTFRPAGYRRASPSKTDLMRNRQPDRLAARAFILALAATLGGCSGSELVQNWTSSGPGLAVDQPQPDYRRVVTENLKLIFPKQESLGDLEISGVRLVDHLKGPAWITCLKLDAHRKPQLYAVFIQDSKVIKRPSHRSRRPSRKSRDREHRNGRTVPTGYRAPSARSTAARTAAAGSSSRQRL